MPAEWREDCNSSSQSSDSDAGEDEQQSTETDEVALLGDEALNADSSDPLAVRRWLHLLRTDSLKKKRAQAGPC